MVKREYLSSYLSCLNIFLVCYIISSNALAAVWLPKTGQYKFYSGIGFADAASQKKQEQHILLWHKTQVLISELNIAKDKIYAQSMREQRYPDGSELKEIEDINLAIDALANESNQLSSSMEDKQFAYFATEYTFAPKNCFGTKIFHKYYPTLQRNNRHYFRHNIDVSFHYKYQFYDQNSWIANIHPQVGLSQQHKGVHYYAVAINFGNTQTHQENQYFKLLGVKNHYNTYHELNFTLQSFPQRYINHNMSYIFSVQDGISFNHGITISNFAECTAYKAQGRFGCHAFYEQVSIAKEINYVNLRYQTLTLQIGYFWKSNTAGLRYSTSGPIFSLWLDV